MNKQKKGRPVGTSKNSEGLYLNDAQLEVFFKAIGEDKKYRLVFNLALYFGLRVSELAGMKLSDIFIGKTPSDLAVTIEGLKNGRKRTYERIDPKLAHELAEWIQARKDRNPYLFPGRVVEDGDHIDAQAVKNQFKRYAQKAGLSKEFSVHNLRASCAVRLIHGGANTVEVMKWLRLRTASAAQVYYDRDEMKDTELTVRSFGSYL
jgi:integrase